MSTPTMWTAARQEALASGVASGRRIADIYSDLLTIDAEIPGPSRPAMYAKIYALGLRTKQELWTPRRNAIFTKGWNTPGRSLLSIGAELRAAPGMAAYFDSKMLRLQARKLVLGERPKPAAKPARVTKPNKPSIDPGMVFGRLTVVERAPNTGRNTRFWCECSCGERRPVEVSALKSGKTKSCGCLSREKNSARMPDLHRRRKEAMARPQQPKPPAFRPAYVPRRIETPASGAPVTTIDAAMKKARQIIGRFNRLEDIDVWAIARDSGLSRYAPPLRAQFATQQVRIAIGQVRAARCGMGVVA